MVCVSLHMQHTELPLVRSITHTRTLSLTHTYTHTHACTYTCTHSMHAHTCAHTHMYACMRTRTRTHTHTRTHTRTHCPYNFRSGSFVLILHNHLSSFQLQNCLHGVMVYKTLCCISKEHTYTHEVVTW